MKVKPIDWVMAVYMHLDVQNQFHHKWNVINCMLRNDKYMSSYNIVHRVLLYGIMGCFRRILIWGRRSVRMRKSRWSSTGMRRGRSTTSGSSRGSSLSLATLQLASFSTMCQRGSGSISSKEFLVSKGGGRYCLWIMFTAYE